jgi:uncharacterized metal-binding protein
MPSGKVHDQITIVLILPMTIMLLLVSYYVNFIPTSIIPISIIIFGYIFSSLMFNGDLDTNSKPYNRWWVFKIIWIPYQLLFKHRSIFTHGIIIGTIIRLLYVSPLVVPMIKFIFGLDLFEILTNDYFLYVFIGLEMGNFSHTVSDKLFK